MGYPDVRLTVFGDLPPHYRNLANVQEPLRTCRCPVVDAAGGRRRLVNRTPRGPTLSRQPSRAARAKGRASAARQRLLLARTSTVAFPSIPGSPCFL
jgi:hypothetical protein